MPTVSQIAVGAIAAVHVIFMLGELLPWNNPLIMRVVLKKWRRRLDLSANDQHLVAMVVHNAGVYNGIVAAGLLASAYVGADAHYIQVALLSGGVVAGVVGGATLSKATFGQAVVGVVALGAVLLSR